MADLVTIEQAKLAARITTDAFDTQITMLLDAAAADLGIAGVEVPEALTPIVTQAMITYFLLHFGQPDEYERLKASYDEQKAQLATHTGFTDWGNVDGSE